MKAEPPERILLRAGLRAGFLGLLLLVACPAALAQVPFLRGDVDGSPSLDITDALRVLQHLFLGEPLVLCVDAADANDTGDLDVSDPVYLLRFLFLGGDPPPEPWPRCGYDPTEDALDCERFEICPQGPCGGFVGIPCGPGDTCELPANHCHAADLPGVCLPVPESCPEIYEPVCGCDGFTYSNDCERLRAGAQKDHEGPCRAVCGGILGEQCPEEFYCEYEPGTCGAADLQGNCLPRPRACPAIFDPVCGCDGQTYGNDCERAVAGVALLHRGPCDEAR